MPKIFKDARVATAEEWQGIYGAVKSQLAKSSDRNWRIAAKNIDNLAPWEGIGVCIFRIICRTINDELPTESTFHSLIATINNALKKVASPQPDKRFVLLYFAQLPKELKARFLAASEGSQSEGGTLALKAVKDSAAFCCLCLGKPELADPLFKTLPLPPINCLEDVLSKRRLIVGSTQWEPLISYKRAHGGTWRASGLYASLLAKLVKLESGEPIEIQCQPLSPNAAVKKLHSGDVHCAVGFAETPNRVGQRLRFVGLMHLIHFIGVVRSGPNSPDSFRDLDFEGAKIIVRTESGGHHVVRDLLGIEDDKVTGIDGLEPEMVLTHLGESQAEFDAIAISDGVTFLKHLRSQETKWKLKALSPSCAVLRTGFMIREDQKVFAEWLVNKAKQVIEMQTFAEEESETLKPFKQFVQRCWAPNLKQFTATRNN